MSSQIRKYYQPYTRHNVVRWIKSGREYFDQLEKLIDESKDEIHLQTYIFSDDSTGNLIADALIAAAERKVKVFLLVDAYGSQKMNPVLIQRLVDGGVNFRKYGLLYSKGKFHIGRRLHHKVTVIDNDISVVGGINVSDNYNETETPAWLDFAVIMKGDISRKLLFVCRKRWYGFRFRKNILKKDHSPEKLKNVRTLVRVRRNDFIKNKHEIAISYRRAIREAEKSIVIVGGYFLPGGRSRRLIRAAIDRGVKIKVLVAEKSDVTLVKYARRYLYQWLIENGVEVYEYHPANVHGKLMVVDGKWTTIGSFDLNNLSTYSNIELNVDILDSPFSYSLQQEVMSIMSNESIAIGKAFLADVSFLQKIRSWISYRLVKSLFVLSVILAGKRERDF